MARQNLSKQKREAAKAEAFIDQAAKRASLHDAIWDALDNYIRLDWDGTSIEGRLAATDAIMEILKERGLV